MKYELTVAAAPSCPTKDFENKLSHSWLGQLLRDGWEPFAVTCMPYTGTEYVWLRREVKQ